MITSNPTLIFKQYTLHFLFLVLLLPCAICTFAQGQAIETGLWYNEKKTAKLQIYKSSDDKYFARVVWLKVPAVDGKTKVDIHNPDKSKTSTPIVGLIILKGFKKTGTHTYEDGTVYDPENGKTYSCIMTHKGDKLAVRGYYGISLIGRTTTWTRVED